MLKFHSARRVVYIFIFGLSFCSFTAKLGAMAPAAIYHDPAIFYDVGGVNPFYYIKDEPDWFKFDLAPYYQHASGAKDADGTKVPLGDRLGRWFMLGLLHGTKAAPTSKPFDVTNYPTLYAANTNIEAKNRSFLSDSFTYSASGFTFGNYSVPIKNETFGIRGSLHFNFGAGFFANVKSGFTHYRMDPDFIDMTLTSTFGADANTVIIDNLMIASQRTLIAEEIGLDLGAQARSALEDTYIEIGWDGKFGMDNENGDLAVRIMPHIAVGAWLPTGKKKDEDKAFSLPTGNNGYFGLSFEGAMSFDFPETIQINVGGGATLFERKQHNSIRVPSVDSQDSISESSRTQSTIYPWKAPVSQRLGTTWHLFAGFMSQHFLDKLSIFASYVYTRKEKDSITMKDTSTRNAFFNPKQLERDSMWESQVFHLGLDYDITEHLAFGAAIQGPITGKRIFRTLTLLGDIRFRF